MSLLAFTIYALAGVAQAADSSAPSNGNTTSGKRGLVFTPNPKWPADNKIWRQQGSDLTWYYNYGSLPSPIYADVPQDQFEFVPMMWGIGDDPKDDQWLQEVKKVMSDGRNISHALAFNEPDAPSSWGGSDIDPHKAAQAWVANFEPLAEMGVKLGLPAVTGAPSGLDWLKQFLGNCSELVSDGGSTKNCTWDVVPVHWYDNFAGLTSHIGERHSLWPDAEVWVTEYALAHQDAKPTEEYYHQTVDYFDKLDYLGRYSYFGAFRAKTSNVGPNAAFLDDKGKLTTIGASYLGVKAWAPALAPRGAVAAAAAAAVGFVVAVL